MLREPLAEPPPGPVDVSAGRPAIGPADAQDAEIKTNQAHGRGGDSELCMSDVSTPHPLPRQPAATAPGRLLAIESSGSACSAALWWDGQLAGHERLALAHGHAAQLMPLIERVAAGLAAWTAIDAIAVTVGPGSFTGIRVGLAAARGLGLAAGRPVLGVSSFAVIAHMADPAQVGGRPLTVVIDPRPGDRGGAPQPLFAQRFDVDLRPVGPAAAVAAADLSGLVAGDRPPAASGITAIDTGPPDAAVLARLVAAGQVATLPPRPVYLKPPDVTRPGARGRP